MNYRKTRFVENLVLLLFPVSILVACTTNGTDQTATGKVSAEEITFSSAQPENPYFTVESSDFVFTDALTGQDPRIQEDMTWSVGQASNDQYVMISPAMHLAIYKTTNGVEQDMSDSLQTANLKESNALEFPDKSVFRFKSDVYNLDEEDINALREHAEFLRQNPQFTLTVNGHSDHTGSAEYNQVLSEQRAQLVRDILVTYGAPQNRIIADGYGESVPLNDIDNLKENRRVELEYSQALMVSEM